MDVSGLIAIRDSLVAPAGVTHYVHDIFGNVIAETAGGGATGATGTVREYIWLYETEIAPTMGSRTTVDRPLAVVDAVNTGSPATWWVHVDHLNRPVKMTNSTKAAVWTAVWQPWGAAQSITGSATLNTRFPGQWFQVEAGLHYNWHRHYDPTLGRYTQPDPLGFVDGPSVYGYVRGAPGQFVDPEGLFVINPVTVTITRVVVTAVAKEILRQIITNSQPSSSSPSSSSDSKKKGVEEWNKKPPPEPGRYSCRYVMYFNEDDCEKGACPPFVTGRGWSATLPGAMSQARQEAQSKIPPGCKHQHHGQMWCRYGSNPPFNVRQ